MDQLSKRLREAGFTFEQSSTALKLLDNSIQRSIHAATSRYVTLAEHEKTTRAYQTDFDHLKSEIQLLERNDFVILKQENERLIQEVDKLKERLRLDIGKLQSGIQLDMNLEKSRMTDDHSLVLGQIKDMDRRLDEEVSKVRHEINLVKWDTVLTISGIAASFTSVLVGWIKFR